METYFSKNADILLKDRHLTQKEFCERLGKSKSNWDNIVKTNNLEMLSKIASLLELSVEEVIGFDKKKFSICGFVKLQDDVYEIHTKDDVVVLLNRINALEMDAEMRI